MSYMETYREWCTNPYFSEETRAELEAIKDNEAEIEDRFYRQLEFGTGGLRGVIGAGTNRMNIYTVRQATQGLANYIISQNGQEKGVAIAHDSRIMSPEFAEEAALCLNANGIKAYVFDSLRPTPELSFTVRELGCVSGIVITASHNPREYNGYKVYWEDGAQITPPHDSGIMNEVKAISDYAVCKKMDKDAAIAAGLYQTIGADIDDPYIEELKKLVVHQDGLPAANAATVTAAPGVDSLSAISNGMTIVYTSERSAYYHASSVCVSSSCTSSMSCSGRRFLAACFAFRLTHFSAS